MIMTNPLQESHWIRENKNKSRTNFRAFAENRFLNVRTTQGDKLEAYLGIVLHTEKLKTQGKTINDDEK